LAGSHEQTEKVVFYCAPNVVWFSVGKKLNVPAKEALINSRLFLVLFGLLSTIVKLTYEMSINGYQVHR